MASNSRRWIIFVPVALLALWSTIASARYGAAASGTTGGDNGDFSGGSGGGLDGGGGYIYLHLHQVLL